MGKSPELRHAVINRILVASHVQMLNANYIASIVQRKLIGIPESL